MNTDYIVEEKQVGPFRCVVSQMEYSGDMNPRENGEPISTMVTWGAITRDYSIGEEQISEPDFSVTCPKCEGSGEDEDKWVVTTAGYPRKTIGIGFATEDEASTWADSLAEDFDNYYVDAQTCERCEGLGEVVIEPDEWVRENYDALVALPLSIRRDWSPTTSIDRDWSDPDGAIYATAPDLLKFWGEYVRDMGTYGGYIDPNEDPDNPRQIDWWKIIERDAPAALRAEVNEYDAWARGEVYYFDVLNEDGEVLDSCCGFIGDESISYAMSEAVSMAEWHVREREKEARERMEWEARDVETVPA